ncbi:MAG: hypothetical protein OM95_16695 [Bdellovibrio sp. ArHS]|uniref:TetR/AcrR family transcriptional regulator n=1 Tax=Bdellovibrio sp. ArHS TaxID=1569284 RepID=UPI000582EA48|nr:TetR/AcrR family transcriptional regulator [Bdellovibrio sp. ArHS]KHD87019.1 MAG: hypothetical protein OM95_16695 [Bdellovibrio sp. ArHS]
MTVKRGRPRRENGIQLETIVKAALELLEKKGPADFSLRGLATYLEVTPMALYHYFPNRAALIREISDFVYGPVVQDFASAQGRARKKTRHLLAAYYQAGLRYPNLTLIIFTTPDAFSKEAARLTNLLAELLKTTDLSPKKRQMWLDILVDFTHGSFIATAMAGKLNPARVKRQTIRYTQQLDELLSQIFVTI